jgi:hypothetical protein
MGSTIEQKLEATVSYVTGRGVNVLKTVTNIHHVYLCRRRPETQLGVSLSQRIPFICFLSHCIIFVWTSLSSINVRL